MFGEMLRRNNANKLRIIILLLRWMNLRYVLNRYFEVYYFYICYHFDNNFVTGKQYIRFWGYNMSFFIIRTYSKYLWWGGILLPCILQWSVNNFPSRYLKRLWRAFIKTKNLQKLQTQEILQVMSWPDIVHCHV